MALSPYKIFWDWVYDGHVDSPIPKPTEDVPDILKYNSPITHTFLLQSFIKNAKLNLYLNTYFNNIGVRYLEKEEFFKFTKKAVRDFKIRRDTIYYTKYGRKKVLFDRMKPKVPLLKSDDLDLLCDIIESLDADTKKGIFSALSIDAPKKQKLKTKKKAKKINLKTFLAENFNVIEVDK